MPKKLGACFVLTGAVLILSALLLLLYNRQEDAHAGQEAENLLSDVQAVIQEKTIPLSLREEEPGETEAPEETGGTEAAEETDGPTMTVVEINGYEYVGYLAIEKLGITLPVMSDWDYARLNVAPCRHFGSTKTDDLVIAAHNFKTHFGRLKELEAGDAVTFTDMDGLVISYTVASLATIAPPQVDAVVDSGHDLVLYTCTPGGQTRVCVFCDRVEEGT